MVAFLEIITKTHLSDYSLQKIAESLGFGARNGRSTELLLNTMT